MAKKKKNYNLLLYELQKEAVNNAKITGGKVSNSELEKIAQDEYLAPIRNVNLGRRAAEATDRKKKQEIITKAKENTKSSTSSNKTTTSKNTTSPTKKRTWFTSGAFSDGYQFGDLTKTITGTVTDINEDITKGILGIGEGLIDTGAYLLGGGAKLFGQEGFSQDMKNFISRDLVEESGAAKLITDLSAPAAINNIVNKEIPFSKDSNAFEQDSLLGDRSDSLVQSGGQLLGTVGLQAVGVPWFVTTGVTSFGSGTEEAFNEDATYGEAGVYGLVAAGAEILTEKLSGGISFGGKTLDDTLLKPLTEKIASKTVQKITNFGLDMVGEGIEEVASEVIQNVGKKLTYEDEKTWGELLTSEEAMDAYLESFIGGFVLGGVGSASQSFAENQSQAQVQGLQQEIAKKTEELNKSQDAREKQIIQETINGLNEELNELTNAQQITDEKELRKQRFTYEAQESDSDIKKAVYESASKVMNNTETTHKFVDVVAKIAEERGTTYKFTNNEQLKELGHIEEGLTTNGLVTDDGEVLINIDSAKSLNVVVGHETTHLLEGTKEYEELQKIAIEYAKAKGEYDTRYKQIEKLYKGKKANIKNELTSDIVGEYLFTDYNFVKELSIKQPTIFEKIRNFISDLVVKFKGTEQEKQLRQLQRTFEKAYKAQGTQTTGTKYSVSDNQGRTLSKGQQEYFKDSKVRDENGNLLTVYHGTDSDFTVFEKKGGKRNIGGLVEYDADSKGFFLATSKDFASVYGNQVKDLYANVTNPLFSPNKTYTDIEMENIRYIMQPLVDADVKNGDLKIVSYSDGSTRYYDHSFYRMPENIWQRYASTETGIDWEHIDSDAFNEVINRMKEKGYDGTFVDELQQDEDGNSISSIFVLNSNQIKNVDNTNPTTNPDIRYSLSEDIAPVKDGFYSQLENVITSKMQNSADAKSVLNLIRNNGVKQDEIAWTGIEDYLNEKGNEKVTKQEVLDYIRDNQLQLEEVEKGDSKVRELTEPIKQDIKDKKKKIKKYLDKYDIDYEEDDVIPYKRNGTRSGTIGDFMAESLEQLVDLEQYPFETVNGVKRYTKEISFSDGVRAEIYFTEQELKEDMQDLEYLYDELNEAEMNLSMIEDEYGDDANEMGLPMYKQYSTKFEGGENYREILYKLPDSDLTRTKTGDLPYHSPHWNEANVLAHTRTQDYTDIEGKKVLFIEEIQSDLHQTGRRKGYVTKEERTKRDRLYEEIDNLRDNKNKLTQEKVNIERETREKWHDLYSQEEARYGKLYDEFVDEVTKDNLGLYSKLSDYFDDAMRLKDAGLKYDHIGENDNYLSKEQVQKYIFLLSKYNEAYKNKARTSDFYYGNLTNEMTRDLGDNNKYQELIKQIQDIKEQMQVKVDERNAIPIGLQAEFPFKKNWNEFALRKIINEAVQKGYDKVAWTTGEQQNERYSLKQYVDEIFYHAYLDENSNDNKLVYDINVFKDDSIIITRSRINEQQLRELLGKDISDQIINSKNYDGVIEGKNLSVGGEGMKGFYDKIIPDYLNKYLKKWNSKVEDVFIGNNKQQGFTITPEMKNAIATQGQPLYSLSAQNEEIAPTGQWNVRGEDIKLQIEEALSPLQETISNLTEQVKTMQESFAPTSQDIVEQQGQEAFNNITDEQAPTVDVSNMSFEDAIDSIMDSGDFEYSSTEHIPSPLEDRDIYEVRKDRKVKAYQYEHPEYKPFFQAEAQMMLYDLDNTIKGERGVAIDELGNTKYYGITRQTTDAIAYLKDVQKYSYAEIRKGLNAIIEDDGKENIGVAKSIEFLLDERLRKGYVTSDGFPIPPNEDYINFLNEKQVTEHNKEAFNALTDKDIPPEQATMNVEPELKVSKQVIPIAEKTAQNGNTELKDTSIETQREERVAKIMAEAPTPQNRKQRQWAKFVMNFVSKGSPFEDLSLKTRNRELMGKWDSMLTSAARAQNTMLNGVKKIDALNKVEEQVSKSLDDIRTKVVNSGKTQEFYEYMYHALNVDRMSLEKNAQAKMAQIKETALKDYDNETIEKISRKRITDKTDQKTAELIENAKEYIRLSETKNKPVYGDSVTAEASQRAVEEFEMANPEFTEWANDVYQYNNALRDLMVENNIISQETADLFAEMYPHYVPIKRVDTKGNAINVPLDTNRTGVNTPIKRAKGGNQDILPMFDTMASRTLQTYKAISKNNFGIELKNTLNSTVDNQQTNLDEILDNVDQQESLLQEGKDGQAPTFTVFENGNKVTYEITQDMYDALKPISDSSLLSTTIKPANFISNFHRGVLTEYNIVFALINPIKDVQDVLMNSQHAAKTYAKIPEATAQIFKKGMWYKEYMANGGEQNSYFDSQDNTYGKENIADKILPLKAISKLNNFIELTPRLAEYIASREAGRSIEVSMLDAARVTTNFKDGGDITKWLNRNGATFLNASIQGAAQQVRNVREAHANGLKGYANLATKFALAGLPAMILNGLLWEDDEDYEELSDYVKTNYWIVGKYGDGNFIRIPKGRMVTVIQESFNQMKHLITGDEQADLNSFLEVLGNNIAPNNPVSDNILSPIVQAVTNKTWYGGDLVPTRLQDVPAEEQYDESIDSLSVAIGQATGISPYKINYVLDQYSGGIGDVFLPMMTPQAEGGKDDLASNLLAPLVNKFTVDSTMKNQSVSDLYELSDKLTVKANSSKATDEDILKNKFVDSVKTGMNELYKKKREIQSSDLPDSEKYEQVRNIQKQINDMAKAATRDYEDMDMRSNYADVGGIEYYKDNEGKWKKVNYENEGADLNEMNMSVSEKNTYFKTKMEISEIVGDYKDSKDAISIDDEYSDEYKEAIESLSDEKKTRIIDAMLSTDLPDEQKAYLYGKYFSSEKTLEKITSSGVAFDDYLTFSKDTLSIETTEEKVEHLYNSDLSDNTKTVLYETSVLTGFDDEKKYKDYKTVKAAGIDINSWLSYKKQEFVADKDSSGKSISGSKKKKVISYVNKLNLSKAQKAIIIKTEYSTFTDYNAQIIQYLDGLDMPYDDFVNILENLDMKVKGNTVYWE